MRRFGYTVAAGAFVGMLIALAMDRPSLLACQGFLMVAGCVLSLHRPHTPRGGTPPRLTLCPPPAWSGHFSCAPKQRSHTDWAFTPIGGVRMPRPPLLPAVPIARTSGICARANRWTLLVGALRMSGWLSRRMLASPGSLPELRLLLPLLLMNLRTGRTSMQSVGKLPRFHRRPVRAWSGCSGGDCLWLKRPWLTCQVKSRRSLRPCRSGILSCSRRLRPWRARL